MDDECRLREYFLDKNGDNISIDEIIELDHVFASSMVLTCRSNFTSLEEYIERRASQISLKKVKMYKKATFVFNLLFNLTFWGLVFLNLYQYLWME